MVLFTRLTHRPRCTYELTRVLSQRCGYNCWPQFHDRFLTSSELNVYMRCLFIAALRRVTIDTDRSPEKCVGIVIPTYRFTGLEVISRLNHFFFFFCHFLKLCRLLYGDFFRIQKVQMYWLQNKPCFSLSCFNIFPDFFESYL